jgi:hypothetical protein
MLASQEFRLKRFDFVDPPDVALVTAEFGRDKSTDDFSR